MFKLKNSKIPAYLITGFLGSGKTTLLNHLLRNISDTKIAVIENEFGEINIDKNLIINQDESIYSLENGCICCSINDQFADTLLAILEFAPDTDLILVETTGVADSNNVAASFFEKQIIEIIEYKAAICIIDASTILDRIKTEEIIARQIAFADLIIINKIDLIRDEELTEIIKFVRTVNFDAEIINSKNCVIDTKKILEANYKQNELQLKPHIHQSEYMSVSFQIPELFDRDLFIYAITSINAIYKEKMLRIKGIIFFEDNLPYSFHSVKDFGDLIALSNDKYHSENSEIVFIGKSLDENIIYRELSSAFSEQGIYE